MRSGSAPQIFAPLRARGRRNSSPTRRSASAPSSAHLLCWHGPPSSQVDIRRASEEFNACGPPRTDAEITPSKIDFLYGTRATEPARAPASVAPRGCPLSLRCVQRAQDGRAGPRRWTLQWPLQGRCSLRRGARPHGGCGWSQPMVDGAMRAFSVRCACLPNCLSASEVAGRSEGARTVGSRRLA